MTELNSSYENGLPKINQTLVCSQRASKSSLCFMSQLRDLGKKTTRNKAKYKKRNLVSKWEAGPLATSICLCKRLASSSASSGPWANFCHSLRLSWGALGTFSGSWGRSRFFCCNRCIETKTNAEVIFLKGGYNNEN